MRVPDRHLQHDKKMFHAIFGFLESMDRYATIPFFNISGKKSKSTIEGILLSLILFIISAMIIIYNIMDAFLEDKPNTNICPVCSGQPGGLPVVSTAPLRQSLRL